MPENETNPPFNLEPSPGVDDLIDFYEELEAIYRVAAAACSVYEDNGMTTTYTNMEPQQAP